MRDPEYRRAYEAAGPRFEYIRQLIDLRNEGKISQKELARMIGTQQPAIARFESGSMNPSFEFVHRVAVALGKKIKIV